MRRKYFFSVGEYAKETHYSPRHVRRLIKEGKISAQKVGRSYLILADQSKKPRVRWHYSPSGIRVPIPPIAPEGLGDKADELWRAGKWDELQTLSEKSKSTLARIIGLIVDHRHSSMADVSLMAGDMASRDLRRHVQKAYPLAVVATVSPLLGLLGTVIGMIGAFDKVSAAGSLGDASLLGGDISKALITTAAGLTIAVPALILYHYFKSRTNLFALMLEDEVGELIRVWYGGGTDANATEKGGDNEN